MGRLLSLSLAIANVPNGLILVDEIENGLYHNAMVNVWQAVAEIAKRFNVQVFATTHSEECIRSAHIAFANRDSYDLRMHRLDPVRGAIWATTYDQEMLEAAFREGLEVR
jgi:predicted ATPase